MDSAYESAVALVGMSGRFPGAATVGDLWRNLLAGVPGLRAVTADELADAGVDPALAADPDYVAVGGPVDGIDLFDAATFGVSPREAETMDPQHRLFLECAWEAMEGAGYRPVNPDETVGVFAGCAYPDYLSGNLAHLISEPGALLQIAVGNERDSLTSLVSYKLGLRGPSLTVQTFCSTSLVAVHLACQSLLTYECGMALAGGAFLPLPQPAGYRYETGGILSPDGRVRSFDAAANGSVMGSGVGVVALKRMSDAIADGDLIHAVILGTAVNNDGSDKIGYTAPGVDGQAAVIETALAVAGVKPESVGYVECHATGTPLGDSIELAAMSRVFTTTPDTPCVLGTVKPSVGHLDRAAGVTGLIRAALSLRNETLPGTPNFQQPNPALAAADDRFTVLTEPRPWPRGDEPRRAGVSSFGLGGTNAHAVLEEAPAPEPREPASGPRLLAFSAGDDAALAAVTDRLRDHLAAHPDLDLGDVAYTLQVSRTHFALRRAVVASSVADAVAALADPARWIDGTTHRRDPVVTIADGDAPATWLADLAEACGRTLPEPSLADGLSALGVRVGDPSDDGVTVTVGSDLPAAHWLLDTVARLWLAGSAIDWPALHGGPGRRVELPTYPFQRKRFWIDPKPVAPAAPPVGRVADRSQWTFLPTWRQHPLPVADLDDGLRAAGPWLVLSADARAEALIERLTEAGAEVVAARAGTAFTQDDLGDATIRVGEQDDIDALLDGLFVAPRTIVHAFSLAGETDFDAAQEHGFHSALTLVRALAERADASPTDLVLMTGGATAVIGSDLRSPEHASLAALAPSIAQENPTLSCRHVDVDALAGPTAVAQTLAAITTRHDGPIAVREGELWLRTYDPCPLPEPSTPPFRDGDTVLITGGLGDVGLVLARHLARTYRCRLVLTARSALPPRDQWSTLADGTDRTARHIRNILALETEGATVLPTSADVGDVAAMRAVVDQAVERFGHIDAVVHAAGAQDERYFNLAHLSTREQCDAHFHAKVHGLLVLQEVLGDQAPDRRIAMSSISAVLGGPALGPYSAANAALDAYAKVARRSGTVRWITVNWDTWQIDPLPTGSREFHMTPPEGVDLFERITAAADRLAHLTISTGAIGPRLAEWVTGQTAADASDGAARHPRPELDQPFVEPADGLESVIAEVWAATLGLETVGANDDFFELGGHSLMAIQLATRMRTAVGKEISPTALVENPTVRKLTTAVAS